MLATRRLALAVGAALSLVALSGCVPPPAPPDPLVSCASLQVSSTYTPPATTAADDVMGAVQPGSGVSGCTDHTGRGVTAATLDGSFDVEGACAAHADDEEWARGTGQLTWSDGSVSQYAASLVGWTFLRIEIRLTGGLWAGATASVPVETTDAVGTCSGAGISEVTIEGGPFVLHPAGSPPSRPLLGVEAIDAGGSHTCALVGGGNAKCWGSNLDGQIGNGGFTRQLVPVDVVGLGPASDITAGSAAPGARGGGGPVLGRQQPGPARRRDDHLQPGARRGPGPVRGNVDLRRHHADLRRGGGRRRRLLGERLTHADARAGPLGGVRGERGRPAEHAVPGPLRLRRGGGR
jgi:hypothetical protein